MAYYLLQFLYGIFLLFYNNNISVRRTFCKYDPKTCRKKFVSPHSLIARSENIRFPHESKTVYFDCLFLYSRFSATWQAGRVLYQIEHGFSLEYIYLVSTKSSDSFSHVIGGYIVIWPDQSKLICQYCLHVVNYWLARLIYLISHIIHIGNLSFWRSGAVDSLSVNRGNGW